MYCACIIWNGFTSRDIRFYKYYERSLENPQRNQCFEVATTNDTVVCLNRALAPVLIPYKWLIERFLSRTITEKWYWNHIYGSLQIQAHLIAFSFSGQRQINMISIHFANLQLYYVYIQWRNKYACILENVRTHQQFYNNMHLFYIYVTAISAVIRFVFLIFCSLCLFANGLFFYWDSLDNGSLFTGIETLELFFKT